MVQGVEITSLQKIMFNYMADDVPVTQGARASAAMVLTYLFWNIAASTPDGLVVYYRKVSNIRRTLLGNKIVDHSDVVGASPVGAAPTTSSFST